MTVKVWALTSIYIISFQLILFILNILIWATPLGVALYQIKPLMMLYVSLELIIKILSIIVLIFLLKLYRGARKAEDREK